MSTLNNEFVYSSSFSGGGSGLLSTTTKIVFVYTQILLVVEEWI